MTCAEAQELITALIDDELQEPDRGLLQTHLEQCPACRRILAEERFVRDETRQSGASLRAPAQLRSRILSDARGFPADARPSMSPRWYTGYKPYLLRPAVLVAFILVLATPLFYLYNQTGPPLASAVFETYQLFVTRQLPIVTASSPSELQERLTRAVSGRFHPMGYDLEAINLKPVAGAVRELPGRKILVAIYEGEGGSLLCYTFLGSERDAPPAAARFVDPEKERTFFAFSHGRVNAVLHREGDLICILLSEMTMDKLLAVARSEAVSS